MGLDSVVSRHTISLGIFRVWTVGQQTPGFWGVTASYQKPSFIIT